MLQTIYFLLVVFLASLIGSLNGLGVSLFLSVTLLLVAPDDHSSIRWIPYFVSWLVSAFFIMSRPKMFMRNFVPVFSLIICCGLGLIAGKVFKQQYSITQFKLLFGIALVSISILFKKTGFFERRIENIYDADIDFQFFDLLLLTIISFSSGFFDFGVAAFIYLLLFSKDSLVKIEVIDVCVFSVLFISSVINLLFLLTRREQVFLPYLSPAFVLVILAGSLLARFSYKLISLNLRRRIVVVGMFLVGVKLIVAGI